MGDWVHAYPPDGADHRADLAPDTRIDVDYHGARLIVPADSVARAGLYAEGCTALLTHHRDIVVELSLLLVADDPAPRRIDRSRVHQRACHFTRPAPNTLSEKCGFQVYTWKGDHYTMARINCKPPIIVQVYLKKELKRGTLKGILRNAGVSRDEFLELHSPKKHRKRVMNKRNH